MKLFIKISIFIPAAVLMFMIDVPPQPQFPYFQLVSEAHAVFGVRRRAVRRGVIIGSTAAAAGASATAVSQQQSATAQQQSANTAASTAGSVPIGTVVKTLPGDCTAVTVGGVKYQDCAGSFYKAAFQGNNLVYVVVQKPI